MPHYSHRFLEVKWDQQEYPLPNGNAVHTGLNSMHLHLDDRVINTFLCHLSLPSLLELHLDINEAPFTDNLLSFFELSPLLKTLNLQGTTFEHGSELLRILSTTPVLTHLYIVCFGSTPFALHHLFTHLAESWLVEDNPCWASEQFLPKLQCLHLWLSNPWDDLSKVFGSISEINNPRRSFNQLQFEFVNYDGVRDNEHSADMMRLMQLKDAGIDLKIVDYRNDKDLLEDYLSSSPKNTPQLLTLKYLSRALGTNILLG